MNTLNLNVGTKLTKEQMRHVAGGDISCWYFTNDGLSYRSLCPGDDMGFCEADAQLGCQEGYPYAGCYSSTCDFT